MRPVAAGAHENQRLLQKVCWAGWFYVLYLIICMSKGPRIVFWQRAFWTHLILGGVEFCFVFVTFKYMQTLKLTVRFDTFSISFYTFLIFGAWYFFKVSFSCLPLHLTIKPILCFEKKQKYELWSVSGWLRNCYYFFFLTWRTEISRCMWYVAGEHLIKLM